MILGGGRMWNGGDMQNHNNLVNGSNDNMLWAATDGEGLEWTPYAISYHHNMGTADPGLHFSAVSHQKQSQSKLECSRSVFCWLSVSVGMTRICFALWLRASTRRCTAVT